MAKCHEIIPKFHPWKSNKGERQSAAFLGGVRRSNVHHHYDSRGKEMKKYATFKNCVHILEILNIILVQIKLS